MLWSIKVKQGTSPTWKKRRVKVICPKIHGGDIIDRDGIDKPDSVPCPFVFAFYKGIVEGRNRGKAKEGNGWTKHPKYEKGGVKVVSSLPRSAPHHRSRCVGRGNALLNLQIRPPSRVCPSLPFVEKLGESMPKLCRTCTIDGGRAGITVLINQTSCFLLPLVGKIAAISIQDRYHRRVGAIFAVPTLWSPPHIWFSLLFRRETIDRGNTSKGKSKLFLPRSSRVGILDVKVVGSFKYGK